MVLKQSQSFLRGLSISLEGLLNISELSLQFLDLLTFPVLNVLLDALKSFRELGNPLHVVIVVLWDIGPVLYGLLKSALDWTLTSMTHLKLWSRLLRNWNLTIFHPGFLKTKMRMKT